VIEAYHEDIVLQAFMLFVQAAREVARYSDSRFFQVSHLSTVKYIALKALVNSNGALSHTDLADWTGTKRHNITTLVKRMRNEGLVETVTQSKDKRFTLVRLTDKGRDLFSQATVIAYDLISTVMSGIGMEEAAQLEGILKVLRRNTKIAIGEQQFKTYK
jgi:DNA-binding MarR family transcriptional regulator